MNETNDPIILQGPNRRREKDLDYSSETARAAADSRAYEGITNALSNSSLLCQINDIGSHCLAMAEVRRHYVPSDDLDKQANGKECINAHMKEGEEPTLFFERGSIIRETLSEV